MEYLILSIIGLSGIWIGRKIALMKIKNKESEK